MTANDPPTTGRVGMVGGGQLARMTHRAAIDLAVHLEVLAAGTQDPAVLAGAPYRVGGHDDLAALADLAADVAVVTLDHELVPNRHLVELERRGHVLRPSAAAVHLAQDKLHARETMQRLGIPVPAFSGVTDADDVARFAEAHGWPVVLKARSGGYDGRGVWVLDDLAAVQDVLAHDGDYLVEALVPIATELAVVTARRPSGEQGTYPVVETIQEDGICNELVMPARVPDEVADAARDLADGLVEDIDATGIVAVELFLTETGELVVNELALRPHNSGHATIDACATSQFANHLRAVLDWPLGDPSMRAPAAAMVNVLGTDTSDDLAAGMPAALAVPGAHVHLYQKTSRPGRKIGHVTVLADTPDEALDAARTAVDRLVTP
jgi:5-(carboxyamino)imidazole ribonucleotide synthase